MLVPFFTKTEDQFQAIKRDLVLDDAMRQQLQGLADDCLAMVERIADQWVEIHPYGLDVEKVRATRDGFQSRLEEDVDRMLQARGELTQKLAPLISFARKYYRDQAEEVDAHAPIYAYKAAHRINARIEMFRLIAQWCWRLLAGDGRST